MYSHIESKENPLLKETMKLKVNKYRKEKSRFLVEGLRFVEEAINSDFEVELVFLSEEHSERLINHGLLVGLKPTTKVHILKDKLLRGICSTENPQGIVAVVKYKAVVPLEKAGFYVLTDKIQDPGNMGTIIRSAHAAGALGVIVTKGTVDVYNEKTLRSTMGSIFKLPIIEDENLDFTRSLQAKGYKLVASTLQGEESIYSIDLTSKVIIAVGNEGNGIDKEVLDLSDIKIKLPMPGGAESLNAAVAASIIMYEIVRQNIFNKKID